MINVGLYFGAAFQLVCILAVIFVPARDDAEDDGEDCSSSSGSGLHETESSKTRGALASVSSAAKKGVRERKKKK